MYRELMDVSVSPYVDVLGVWLKELGSLLVFYVVKLLKGKEENI